MAESFEDLDYQPTSHLHLPPYPHFDPEQPKSWLNDPRMFQRVSGIIYDPVNKRDVKMELLSSLGLTEASVDGWL